MLVSFFLLITWGPLQTGLTVYMQSQDISNGGIFYTLEMNVG